MFVMLTKYDAWKLWGARVSASPKHFRNGNAGILPPGRRCGVSAIPRKIENVFPIWKCVLQWERSRSLFQIKNTFHRATEMWNLKGWWRPWADDCGRLGLLASDDFRRFFWASRLWWRPDFLPGLLDRWTSVNVNVSFYLFFTCWTIGEDVNVWLNLKWMWMCEFYFLFFFILAAECESERIKCFRRIFPNEEDLVKALDECSSFLSVDHLETRIPK